MKEDQEESLGQNLLIFYQQDLGNQKNEGINYSPEAFEIDNELEKKRIIK